MEKLPFNLDDKDATISYLRKLYDLCPIDDDEEGIKIIKENLTYSNGHQLSEADAVSIYFLCVATTVERDIVADEEIHAIASGILTRKDDCEFKIPCDLCPLNNSPYRCSTTYLFNALTGEDHRVIRKAWNKIDSRDKSYEKLDGLHIGYWSAFSTENPLFNEFSLRSCICGADYSKTVQQVVKALYENIVALPRQVYLMRSEAEGGLELTKEESLRLAKLFMRCGVVTTADELKKLLIEESSDSKFGI